MTIVTQEIEIDEIGQGLDLSEKKIFIFEDENEIADLYKRHLLLNNLQFADITIINNVTDALKKINELEENKTCDYCFSVDLDLDGSNSYGGFYILKEIQSKFEKSLSMVYSYHNDETSVQRELKKLKLDAKIFKKNGKYSSDIMYNAISKTILSYYKNMEYFIYTAEVQEVYKKEKIVELECQDINGDTFHKVVPLEIFTDEGFSNLKPEMKFNIEGERTIGGNTINLNINVIENPDNEDCDSQKDTELFKKYSGLKDSNLWKANKK